MPSAVLASTCPARLLWYPSRQATLHDFFERPLSYALLYVEGKKPLRPGSKEVVVCRPKADRVVRRSALSVNEAITVALPDCLIRRHSAILRSYSKAAILRYLGTLTCTITFRYLYYSCIRSNTTY